MADPTIQWKGVTYTLSELGEDLYRTIEAFNTHKELAALEASATKKNRSHYRDIVALRVLFYGLAALEAELEGLLP